LTRYLALRAGEKLIDQLDSVEDTKGNNGERGTFSVKQMFGKCVFHITLFCHTRMP